MPARRRFGSIRRRDSGRYQVRYLGPDGKLHNAPDTFARKSEAERYLALVETQIARGDWIDPERAQATVPTTRHGGSPSAPACDRARSGCTHGCWRGTSNRTLAECREGGWTPR